MNSSEILIKIQHILYKEINWKYPLQNGDHFASASLCHGFFVFLYYVDVSHKILSVYTLHVIKSGMQSFKPVIEKIPWWTFDIWEYW